MSAIRSTYTDPEFAVADRGETSDRHRQFSGICEGCPLSEFLLVIVMCSISGG